MKPRLMTLAVCALVVWAAPGRAQQAGAEPEPLALIAMNLTAREDSAAGRVRSAAERDAARPGDVIEYRLVFTNPRQAEVRDVVLENPVPEGMSYVAGSASSGRAGVMLEYSIDGGRTWWERPEIEVVDEQGRRVRRPAPPEQYTSVRWTLTGAVASGAKVEASYRVRVRAAVSTADGGAGGSPR
ncbi:hypothetical protein BH23GEM9_BH23GEM9_20470 [soil metagenome]